MYKDRIEEQVKCIESKAESDYCLIGCGFDRLPLDSTPYYTEWLNNMNEEDIYLQRFRECTIICPSWMYKRVVYDRISEYRKKLGSTAAFRDDFEAKKGKF